MVEELVQTVECSCGAVFEPEDEEVDQFGERWTRCPSCQAKVLIPARD